MGKSAFISVALCLEEFIVTSFTAVTATINNIGPGLELVGPTQNFFSIWVILKICSYV